MTILEIRLSKIDRQLEETVDLSLQFHHRKMFNNVMILVIPEFLALSCDRQYRNE